MDPAPAEAFWDFAVAAYARAGVRDAALELQERHGASVMVLLWLCWTAAAGHAADAGAIAAIRARAALLEENLLIPLRAARQALGGAARAIPAPGIAAAREALLGAELGIERLQAGRLAAGWEAPPASPGQPGARARAALRTYLGQIAVGSARARALADGIAHAIFDAR